MKKRLVIICLINILLLSVPLKAEDAFQWRIGEKLTYKVKWAFIRLGTVKLELVDTLRVDSVPVRHARFHIDSNPILFFVNMHSVFDCYLDSSARPLKYIASEKIDGKLKKAVYNFYYSDSVFTIDFYSGGATSAYRRKTLPLTETVFDGISLISYSRRHIANPQKKILTAFLDDDLGKVKIDYLGEGESIKIGAIKNKIPTYTTKGTILMKGIAGVTGPFKGWFARDRQRPPLRALLKVFIGNVEVELEKWEGWSPPEL